MLIQLLANQIQEILKYGQVSVLNQLFVMYYTMLSVEVCICRLIVYLMVENWNRHDVCIVIACYTNGIWLLQTWHALYLLEIYDLTNFGKNLISNTNLSFNITQIFSSSKLTT